jgi:transcriptional regulator with XRE-family HTH domain
MKETLTRAQRMARMLRALSGLSQREFERETRVPKIGDIEDGSRNPSTRQLDRMASILDVTLTDGEEILRDFEARRTRNLGRADSAGPQRIPGLWRRAPEIEEIVDHYAARFASRRDETPRSTLRASERAQALELWQRLEPLETFEDMALVVSKSREFQRWAMVERLCDESERAAAKDSGRAMLLARAAVEVASLLKVPEGWRRRLLGYATAYVANALRVAEDFDAADRTCAEARTLWSSGNDSEELLDPGRLLELEASLRRAQCRFADALELLKHAATGTRRPEHVALKEASTLEAMGDYAGSITILRRVAPRVDKHPEARLRTIQRFNLAVTLTFVGRYREAARLVPVVRRLAKELGDDLDLIRSKWLEGRVAAGLGRTGKALEALEDARRAFAERNLHYEVALCFLEMAVIHLERGELDEVQRLTAELVPIFKAKRIHRVALAALRLFAIAAKRQAATAGFTRDLLDYFFRARHDPALRFKPRGER